MRKSIWVMALALCLVIMLLPTAALAAGEYICRR